MVNSKWLIVNRYIQDVLGFSLDNILYMGIRWMWKKVAGITNHATDLDVVAEVAQNVVVCLPADDLELVTAVFVQINNQFMCFW